jgi:hypothetical protein
MAVAVLFTAFGAQDETVAVAPDESSQSRLTRTIGWRSVD